MKTAILVDGGFYLKRAKYYKRIRSPKESAQDLFDYCRKHLEDNGHKNDLYRIFYYDCPPFKDKLQHPLTGKLIDFSETDTYKWNIEFIDSLKCKRKTAIRLGNLLNDGYNLKKDVIKKLSSGELTTDKLKPSHFEVNFQQKCVDMKIGLDIASMAYKRLVDQIVLISGDSDFVPAAKLARREGIDFILDPLGQPVKPELNEHIDGKKTYMYWAPKEDREPAAKITLTKDFDV